VVPKTGLAYEDPEDKAYFAPILKAMPDHYLKGKLDAVFFCDQSIFIPQPYSI
jgi:hypothetical protein